MMVKCAVCGEPVINARLASEIHLVNKGDRGAVRKEYLLCPDDMTYVTRLISRAVKSRREA